MIVVQVLLLVVLGSVISIVASISEGGDGSLVHFAVNIGNNDVEQADTRRGLFDEKDALRIRNQFPIQYKHVARIRGGNVSDTLNFPYMAAILINDRLWCAGAIVDVEWVLTAAHCLNYVLHVSPMKSLGRFVKVRVGSVNAHDGGRLIGVLGAVRHPKFEEEPVPHADVALLKLAGSLELGTHVNLIKIYRGFKEPFAQSFVVVSGWGATRGSPAAMKDPTPELMTSRLKVRSRRYCTDAYELVNGLQFTEDFFCASLRNGTRDACLFDAGAPAVQQNRLVGIMSFGPEQCGDEKKAAVFIKAFYFRDFVKHTIANHKTNEDLVQAIHQMAPEMTDRPAAIVTPEDMAPLDEHYDESLTEEEKSHESY